MELPFPFDGDRDHRLVRDIESKLRRYQESSSAQRQEAYLHLIDQLGRDRTARWSRWVQEIGQSLTEIEEAMDESSNQVSPPPEPPSALVNDIVELGNELGRELLSAWAYLGRVVLAGSVRRN